MLSTNSLQAFTAASTAAPRQASGPVRLAPEQVSGEQRRTATAAKLSLPNTMPSTPLPRGSLLNLSV